MVMPRTCRSWIISIEERKNFDVEFADNYEEGHQEFKRDILLQQMIYESD
jgi:hypothetical protein